MAPHLIQVDSGATGVAIIWTNSCRNIGADRPFFLTASSADDLVFDQMPAHLLRVLVFVLPKVSCCVVGVGEAFLYGYDRQGSPPSMPVKCHDQ